MISTEFSIPPYLILLVDDAEIAWFLERAGPPPLFQPFIGGGSVAIECKYQEYLLVCALWIIPDWHILILSVLSFISIISFICSLSISIDHSFPSIHR